MIAQNIKRFRTAKKLSQEQLAQKAGITYSTVAKLESGANRNPTVNTLQRIAKALDVSLDDLVKER
jgi:transcriptional regulator with XRE-family HTH domain